MRALMTGLFKTMTRVLTFRLIVVAAVMGSALQTVAAGSDNLIVPGQRIGPISIGMSKTELYRTMGEPTEMAGAYAYNFGKLSAVVDARGHVGNINCDDPKFVTPEGIHVGSSQLAMEARMGPPELTRKLDGSHFIYCYKRSSLCLVVGNGTIYSIGVSSPHR